MNNIELLHKFLCIVKISYPVILQTWENKPGAGADPNPFWTWWYLIYTLPSAAFPLNVRIIWSDTFSNCFSSYVACVCNNCRRTNQNRRLTMGLMSHLSCVYYNFSSYHVSFSLMTSLTMIGLGPGHLVRALSYYLKILLVVWVEYFQLVESQKCFQLVESQKYFQVVESQKYYPAQKNW